jgi:GNAT superfamily N-acetyltransferase
VANQVIGDLAEAWPTAQRLMAAGLDPADGLAEMAFVVRLVVNRAMDAERAGSEDVTEFEPLYAALPLPDADRAAALVHDAVRAEPGITADDVVAAVVGRLEVSEAAAGTGLAEELVEQVIEDAYALHHSLAILAGDRLVDPADGDDRHRPHPPGDGAGGRGGNAPRPRHRPRRVPTGGRAPPGRRHDPSGRR